METWWPRSLERHFKAILSSSRSSPFSFRALTKSRSLHTLHPLLTPFDSLRHPFFPSPLLRPISRRRPLILRLLLFRPYAIDPENISSSVSPGQDLDWKDHHQRYHQQSVSEDEAYDDHLLHVQQAKQGRFIPVKAYFLCTRFFDFYCFRNLL